MNSAAAGDRAESQHQDDFPQRLRAAMEERGWNQAQTAKAVSEHLASGKPFNAANLSHYLSGRSRPTGRYHQALVDVLALKDRTRPNRQATAEQVPGLETAVPATADADQPQQASQELFVIEDAGDQVRLRIDTQVPWPVGLKVLDALKGQLRS